MVMTASRIACATLKATSMPGEWANHSGGRIGECWWAASVLLMELLCTGLSGWILGCASELES